MKCFKLIILLLILLICRRAFCIVSTPRVLSQSETKPYCKIFNDPPEKIRKAFGMNFKQEDFPSDFKWGAKYQPYPQTILMPNNETLMIISTTGDVGLIIFDTKTKLVKEAFSWSGYLRTEIEEPIDAFDKVHFRFNQHEDTWELIAEVHAITGGRFEPSTHYFWQFGYYATANSHTTAGSSSSFRYCTIDKEWGPRPERINRSSSRQDPKKQSQKTGNGKRQNRK